MNIQPTLHNIRILDFTRVLAGPYAARLLGDFGAEIIKVQWPPSLEDDPFAVGYYRTWNRGKRGVTLNMNTPEGRELAKRLVQISDAVIENYAPRVMENWGLDYGGLKKIKPDIILVSLSVMGHTGPRRDYSGYGPTVHALSGLTGRMHLPDGTPAGPGLALADHLAGLKASLLLLAALEERRQTGRGRHIDISETAVMEQLLTEDEPPAAPRGVYLCRDGRWCALSAATEAEWRGLQKALGQPARLVEPRFADIESRQANKAELDGVITAWTHRYTAKEVMVKLQACGVAAGIVQDAADLAADPQLKARGFLLDKGGLTDASPVRMGKGDAAYDRPAPAPGLDNDYVYGELLGMSAAEMAALQEKGVI